MTLVWSSITAASPSSSDFRRPARQQLPPEPPDVGGAGIEPALALLAAGLQSPPYPLIFNDSTNVAGGFLTP